MTGGARKRRRSGTPTVVAARRGPITPRQALSLVRRHGVMLEAARGPVPNLVDEISGEKRRGSWWTHPHILVTRLVEGRITYVHSRLWPALVRIASRLQKSSPARLREVHTRTGAHRIEVEAFPRRVPDDVRRQAAALTQDAAIRLLGERVVPFYLGVSAAELNDPRRTELPYSERMIEMEQTTNQTPQLHEDKFLKIFWDESTRIIGIDWKETTSSMTDEEFKAELTLFAEQVEQKKARGILVDVIRFRHRPGPDVQPWRVKNISNRYGGAGVGRFAFLFPEGAQIPPMMNQSSPGENFLTRAFTDRTRAVTWLGGRDDLSVVP